MSDGSIYMNHHLQSLFAPRLQNGKAAFNFPIVVSGLTFLLWRPLAVS